MADSRIDPKDAVLEALRSTDRPRSMMELARQWRIGLSSVSKGLGRLLESGEVQCEEVERETPKGMRRVRLWSLRTEPEPDEPEVEKRRGLGCLSCDVGVRHQDTALCKPCHGRIAVKDARRRLDELQAVRDRMGPVSKEVREQLIALCRYWERKAGVRRPEDTLEWAV